MSLLSLSFAYLGQWYDPDSNFNNCTSQDNPMPIEPYIECVNVYAKPQANQYILEYHFGFKGCNPCCVTIPKGPNNKLISTNLNLNNVDLPTVFCPGYRANRTVFNVTYNPSVPISSYYISWKLGNKVANSSAILPSVNYSPPNHPHSYILPFGPACGPAPLSYLACYNPCNENGSNVAVANHPLRIQKRLAIAPVATCGWQNWTNTSVVIIGGGSGLGFSLYEMFVQLGANVKVGGRFTGMSNNRSIGAYPGINPAHLIGHNMDVRSSSEIHKAFEYVINNMSKPLYVFYLPGIAAYGEIDFYSKADLKELYDINVFGFKDAHRMFNMAVGRDDNRSKFTVVLSTSAYQVSPALGGYSASKGSADSIVRVIAAERIFRTLNGKGKTKPMLMGVVPDNMQTDWSWNNWFVPAGIRYLTERVKTPRDAFATAIHTNPLITPALTTASQMIQMASLPSNIIDIKKSSMAVAYPLPQDPTYYGIFQTIVDTTLNSAILDPIEDHATFQASSPFSGSSIQYTYGDDESALGQF